MSYRQTRQLTFNEVLNAALQLTDAERSELARSVLSSSTTSSKLHIQDLLVMYKSGMLGEKSINKTLEGLPKGWTFDDLAKLRQFFTKVKGFDHEIEKITHTAITTSRADFKHFVLTKTILKKLISLNSRGLL